MASRWIVSVAALGVAGLGLAASHAARGQSPPPAANSANGATAFALVSVYFQVDYPT